jgi:hypothetical protein
MGDALRVTVRGAVPATLIAELAPLVARHFSLERVVRWGLAHRPPRLVTEVIKQDEFSQDVVLALPGGHFLVYDTT